MRTPTYTMSTLISFSFCFTFFMIVSSPMIAGLYLGKGKDQSERAEVRYRT